MANKASPQISLMFSLESAEPVEVTGSTPLSDYSAKGDAEIIPTSVGKQNPAFTVTDVAGVEENHSSTNKSVPNGDGNRAQYNDDELGDDPSQGELDPAGYDPNLSGPHPTEPLNDWCAGKLSSWQENSDYLDFLQGSMTAESRLLARTFPGPSSYASNGGMAAIPSGSENTFSQEFGSDSVSPQSEFGNDPTFISGIYVAPIVRRS